MKMKFLLAAVLFFFASTQVEAGWFFNNPDPDRPNIFKRMGRTVTGLFKKKERLEVSPAEVRRYSPEPEEEWVSASSIESIPQAEPSSFVEEPMPAPRPERVASKKPRPAPTAEPFDEQEVSVERYVEELKKLILRKATLPEEAKGTGIKETVKVYFVLDSIGGLKKVYIPEKYRSSYGFINEAAMATVKEASPEFPPMPKNLGQLKEPLFHIEITYEDTL